MTQHADNTTGAWLVLGGSQEPSSTMLFSGVARDEHVELTPAECVAVSAALLSWRSGGGPCLRASFEELARSSEFVGGGFERWLRAWSLAAEDSTAEPSDGFLLERLGRDLRLVGVADARSSEADLLAGAVALQRDHLRLRDDFASELREARLEAVRQLAYGAGHEINNPLANIATRGQSLLRDEPDPQRRRKLATIVDQAFRARDMIGGLMVFAKPPKADPRRVALGELVASVLAAFAEVPGAADVTLSSRLPEYEVWGWIDPTLISEALHAIVLNAVEAGGAGSTIVVTVAGVPEEGCHTIVVSDDGGGFESGELPVVFDPFHCGREAGRGLGVGLSKAWALTQASGGRIAVADASSAGATVRLEVPVCLGGVGGNGAAEARLV